MNELFILLFLGLLILLPVGLIRPSLFQPLTKKLLTRRQIGAYFGGLLFIFLVLAIATTPLPKENKKAGSQVSTQSSVTPKSEEKSTQENQSIQISEPVKSEPTKQQEQTYKVTKVIDGDTIQIEGAKTVRYIGIDTPETVDPRKSVQCYGKEASSKNKELVEGKQVRLEKDVSETDKYGRLLRYVYIGDTFVNDYLVRQGYAHASSYPPDIKYQEQFRQAQEEARSGNRGLWSACDGNSINSLPKPTTASTGSVPGSSYTGGDKDCSDFSTQSEAQVFFISQGGPGSDPHRLDRDRDGVACETLP